MGIGDWGLGIGDWAQSPIPIPNPLFTLKKIILIINLLLTYIIIFKYYYKNYISLK